MSYKESLIFDNRNFILTFFYYLLRKIELLNIIFNRSEFESFFFNIIYISSKFINGFYNE